MARMKARLIYNPTSGKEQVKKNLADLLVIIEKAGYETSVSTDQRKQA